MLYISLSIISFYLFLNNIKVSVSLTIYKTENVQDLNIKFKKKRPELIILQLRENYQLRPQSSNLKINKNKKLFPDCLKQSK